MNTNEHTSSNKGVLNVIHSTATRCACMRERVRMNGKHNEIELTIKMLCDKIIKLPVSGRNGNGKSIEQTETYTHM